MSGFIEAPISEKGHAVSIAVDQIASFRGHTVTSYTYEEWTIVVLKNGATHDTRLPYSEFKRLVEAVSTDE
jgi:hypothetical protein